MITYDPLYIEYNNQDEEEKEPTDKSHYYLKDNMLTEIEVDPGYELESLQPSDLIYLDKLRERFALRKDEQIPYYDIKAACYKIGNKLKKPISDFQILHLTRRLWRAGYTRRFVRGKAKTRKVGRGEYYGVHYVLYPKED